MGRAKCWPRSWPDLTLGLRLFSPNVGKPPPTSNKRDKRMSKWVIRVFIFCLCWDFGGWIVCNFAVLTEQYNSRQWFTTWTHHSFDPSSARRVALLTRGLFLNSPSLSIHIHIFWFVLVSIAMWEWCSDCFFLYWVWLVWRFW